MAIRITGMYSGLDTESIISELASAQSFKKNKLVKEQTKLSWKQDAWKALNTKIYNFYTNVLDNMRFQASYLKKAAKVSNSNALSVVVNNNAVNGTQSVKVRNLAKTGKLTGAELTKDLEGKNVTSSTKLKDLGIGNDASFDVTVGGKKTTIKLSGDMKISDVVTKLKNAGVNASFDNENHRFFISAKESGKAADFSITANNTAGMNALESMGLLTKISDNEKDPIRKEYQKWADYLTDTDAYNKAVEAEVQKRAEAYKKANDDLEAKNAKLKEEIAKLQDDENDKYANTKDKSADELSALADELYDELYGELKDKTGEDGQPVVGEDGKTVQERTGGLKGALDEAKANLQTATKALEDRIASGEEISEEEMSQLNQAVEDARIAVADAQAAFDDKKAEHSTVKSIAEKQGQIETNNTKIEDNNKYYGVTTETDEEGNEVVTGVYGSDDLKKVVEEEYTAKAKLAESILSGDAYKGKTFGVRIEGDDAEIEVDGATFTSSSNDFNVNGMSITVYETTGDNEVTITTTDDVDGIYDMIKNFFTEYNKLINEMDALYNADSAKGYDPLLSEEKAEMADSEIEEWEKKIKDSLLRRDGTLGDVTNAIKTVMLQGATVNGKTMYLSDFGINTLGYFNAADNEKGAYHINGDSDDINVKGENDMLRKMLMSDSETTMNFFTGLANNLYNKLSDKMTAIKDTRSMFTVYNDKVMKKEYEAYKEKIAKEEEKLNSLMDKWYEKFSRMETAMAKLQSKSGGLAGLLGGQ